MSIWMAYERLDLLRWVSGTCMHALNGTMGTCNDFWPLEVFIGMEVARRNGKVQAEQHQRQIRSSPH